jgi:hypothetical protein
MRLEGGPSTLKKSDRSDTMFEHISLSDKLALNLIKRSGLKDRMSRQLTWQVTAMIHSNYGRLGYVDNV